MSEMWVQHLDDIPSLWDKLPELAALKHTQRGKYEACCLDLNVLAIRVRKNLTRPFRNKSTRKNAIVRRQRFLPRTKWPRALAYDKDDDALKRENVSKPRGPID